MNECLIISSEFPPGLGGIGQHAYNTALAMHKISLVLANQEYAEASQAFHAALPKDMQLVHFDTFLEKPCNNPACAFVRPIDILKDFGIRYES